MWNIGRSELRMSVRQRSYYSFLILWVAVLSLLFLLQKSAPALTGYTNMTATVVNIVLYIIPLFMLISGSFSIASEIENGQWRLLNTYPLHTMSYIIGKIGGQFISQLIVFTCSYGISLAIGLVLQEGFSGEWLWSIYLFSVILIFFFLVLGITIGCIVSTRWQALSISVMVWFFFIMIWPTALISILGLVPYIWIEPLMKVLLMINPAEFIRANFIIILDGGTVFGQAYDSLVTFLDASSSAYIHIAYFIGFMTLTLSISMLSLERRKRL